MRDLLPYLAVGLAFVVATLAVVIRIVRGMVDDIADSALARRDRDDARHAAENARQSQEVRREVDRGSFDDAVDRL